MKFTTVLALVASANGAVLMGKREAEADPAPDPWCGAPGQPCWKRDADASPWCGAPGQPCWKVKRAAEAFADTFATFTDVLMTRNPAPDMSSPVDGFHAAKAKRAVDHLANIVALAEREAAPAADYYGALQLEKKFALEPAAAAAAAKRDADPDADPWCGAPGQPCWKRAVQEDKRWCGAPGQPCWKAKRAAEAVFSAIGDIKEREADPEADPWCGAPGQPCWKAKREADPEADPWCGAPGQPCWKAKRDLHAMANAARAVVESFE